MTTNLKKCLFAISIFGYAASSAAFDVDGIIGVNDSYTEAYIISAAINGGPGGGTTTSEARLYLGAGASTDQNSSADSLFMLFEMPTDLHDLTFGDNTSPGWGISEGVIKHPHQGGIHMIGSEELKFNLAGSNVDMNMAWTNDGVNKEDSLTTSPNYGYILESNGGGRVLSAATSLDYNLQYDKDNSVVGGLGEDASFAATYAYNSPGTGCDRTSDASFYACLDADHAEYEYRQMYEFEINTSGLAVDLSGDNLLAIAAYISNAMVHASPPKHGDSDIGFGCLDDYNPLDPCDVIPPPAGVPEPGSLALLGLGLMGLGWSRRRKRSSILK